MCTKLTSLSLDFCVISSEFRNPVFYPTSIINHLMTVTSYFNEVEMKSI